MPLDGRKRRKGTFWLVRGAAGINLAAVILTLLFLLGMGRGSFGERMEYIHSNPTAWNISWAAALASALGLLFVFTLLTLRLDRFYRSLLQMAWLIGVIGTAAWILHDLLQMTVMPLLSLLFLEVPTPHLVDHILQWEKLLVQLVSGFSYICFAISGFIYTSVMFRTPDFPSSTAVYSLVLWSIVLVASISVRWMEALLPWVLAGSLLLLIPWYWQLSNVLSRSLSE